MTKKIESFNSKKFDLNTSKVIGGVGPIYGKWYSTNAGKYDPNSNYDTAQTTYNVDPTRLAGQDNLRIN